MTRNSALILGGILTLGLVPWLYARARQKQPKPDGYTKEIRARQIAEAEARDAGFTYEEREAA